MATGRGRVAQYNVANTAAKSILTRTDQRSAMPEIDHYPVSEWIEHAINQVGDLYRLLSNDGHTQGQNLALDLRGTLVTLKKHYDYEVENGFSSADVGGYAAQWQNEHPSRDEQGWYWYWHPDLGEPTPILVMWSADPEDYGWKYRPSKYPADENEWWLPMGYGPDGPELPSAA